MKSRDDKPPRAWNSTIPRRTKGIERTPLTGPVGPTRKPKPRKPIAKQNPERQKKAAKRAAAKHRAYMASETRKAVDARAEGRCEYRLRGNEFPDMNAAYVGLRCVELNGLQHHHKTYARYGGKELPEDILKVCKPHHDYLESMKPAGNRRSRSPRT